MNKNKPLGVIVGMTLAYTFLTMSFSLENRIKISGEKLKKFYFTYTFKQIHPDPVISNLDMPGSFGKYGVDNMCGKLIRALRFKNITDAVEDRYHLPRGILLAMIIEESTGMDLFPNAKDDGGIGLIHMQPCSAKDFGLKTYKDCNALVCKKHGKDLRKILEDAKYDRKKVINYDDRLHPIKNIDAAGRMLAYHIQKEPMKDLGPIRSAIKRYAGKYNYKQYWNDIVKNMSYLDDKESMRQIAKYFNEINPKLLINGKPADFATYIRVCQQQNDNYGLSEYKKLPKYEIINSDGGASMYKNYINPAKKNLKSVCGN